MAGAVVALGLAGGATWGLSGDDDVKRYEWLPADSAPKDFPVEVLSGRVLTADGGVVPIPDGRVTGQGWGLPGAIVIPAATGHPPPEALAVRWLSLVEDAVWQARVELPAARVVELLERGHIDAATGERVPYDTLVVGLAPGGHVSVWLSGGAWVERVATGAAERLELSWEEVRPGSTIPRGQYVATRLSGTKASGAAPEPGLFERRAAQHPWTFETRSGNPVDLLHLETWDGERMSYDLDRVVPEREARGLPRFARLAWKAGDGTAKSAHITFAFDGVEAAFARIAEEPGVPVLAFDVADTDREIDVVLRVPGAVLPLDEVAEVKIYRRRQ